MSYAGHFRLIFENKRLGAWPCCTTQGSPELYAIPRCGLVKVILIRKLAGALNGIDLTACNEGDVMEMSAEDARVLIAEAWAVPLAEQPTAHDRPRRPRSKQQR